MQNTTPSSFTFLRDGELEDMSMPPQLVTDVLACGAFGILFGASGVGKTFVALSLAFAVATGTAWLGHEVVRGLVVYVAAEGTGGLPSRIRAWKRAHDVSGEAGVHFLKEPFNLVDPNDVKGLIQAMLALPERPALIVIDTLARSVGGKDENSTEDMGEVVRYIDEIRRETGAAVLLIHHTGKKKGAKERGSTALRGAADCMIEVTGSVGSLCIRCDKARDLPPFKNIQAVLTPSMGSCVVVAQDGAVALAPSDATPEKQGAALQALSGLGGGPVTNTQWREASKLKDRTFQNVRGKLVRTGHVCREGEGKAIRYSLTERGKAWVTANCKTTATALPSSDGTLLHAISSPVGGDCSSAAAGEEEAQ